MDNSPAIAVRDLRKVYGDKAAVDGLNLTVPRGCFFGFLGPNGAGKITTIRMLTGLIPPTSGSIEMLGMPHARRRDRDQAPHRPGAGRIAAVRPPHRRRVPGVRRPHVRPAAPGGARSAPANCSNCSSWTDHRKLIAEYSKGMRKRAAMAAALIHHPDLFLMDEPFEGVDAVGARLMKDILLDQVRRGATIFLTSHVLEVVERLCDRVAIINEGKIVMEGSMEDLREGAETLEDVFVRVVGAERALRTAGVAVIRAILRRAVAQHARASALGSAAAARSSR